MDERFDLNGKVILVTGGSRGLGAEMVRDFARQGADVIISSRNIEKCEEIAHEVNQMGRKALPVACDVSKLHEIDSLFKRALDEFGKLDVAVNNAGANVTKPAVDVTEKDWDFIFDVNIKGLFFCCQQAGKIMIQQNSGKIINLSSVGGAKSYKRIAPYTASKAAVIHMTRSLASEWARYNVYVNSIAPGLISTDINEEEISDERLFKKMIKAIPLRRLGNPHDVSTMAVYLASDASNYVTGQTFYLDGGTLAE